MTPAKGPTPRVYLVTHPTDEHLARYREFERVIQNALMGADVGRARDYDASTWVTALMGVAADMLAAAPKDADVGYFIEHLQRFFLERFHDLREERG